MHAHIYSFADPIKLRSHLHTDILHSQRLKYLFMRINKRPHIERYMSLNQQDQSKTEVSLCSYSKSLEMIRPTYRRPYLILSDRLNYLLRKASYT